MFTERVKTFVAQNYSWESDGEGFKDYKTRVEIDSDSSRLRFGDISGLETIQTETRKLGSKKAYEAFPVEKRSERYVLYLQPERFHAAPTDLREAIKDQPEKLAIMDKVFSQVPSYPDVAIVGTPTTGSEMVIWQDASLEGFTEANESVKAFYQDHNIPLSLAERVYFHFFVPSLPEMLKNLSSTSPRVTKADSFWLRVNEVLGSS